MERFLNWLTYKSGVYSVRFQAWHLAINYSLLALALVIYGLGIAGTGIIIASCIPGAIIFLVSVEAFLWKKAVENDNSWDTLIELMQNRP